MNNHQQKEKGRPPPIAPHWRPRRAETRSHNPYESTAQGGNTLT
jgi:hypothetical protein